MMMARAASWSSAFRRLPQKSASLNRVASFARRSALDTGMGQGDALPQSGAAEPLSFQKFVEDSVFHEAFGRGGEQPAEFFQYAFLACRRTLAADPVGGKEIGGKHFSNNLVSVLGFGRVHSFRHGAVTMIGLLFLVLFHLSVDLVHKPVDGGVHILFLTVGENVCTV